ncbi:hypothetical protein [Halosimplex sp. TS25]|uniref:hypothetical protein n=1 Tax=Halosimplex rarum TaxID=3396619 RepID=UPI0039E7D48A
MSEGSDPSEDHWEVFDEALATAREQLEAARTSYRQLGELHATPAESYASALADLEQLIDETDGVLDVTPEDAADATATADRVTLVSRTLDAMLAHQTDLLESELEIYATWLHSLKETPVATMDLSDELDALQAFVENENYGPLRTGDHFTLSQFRADLQVVDSFAREELSVSEYVEYCLTCIDSHQSAFTEDLRTLVQEDVSYSIKSDRKPINDLTQTVRDRRKEDGLGTIDCESARIALEGTMMLRYQTALALAAHNHRSRLSSILDSVDDASHSKEDLTDTVSIDDLEQSVTGAVVEHSSVSVEERVFDLLREHDGSLLRALSASDLDPDEFFATVQTGLEDGPINDLEAHFE